MRAMKLAWAEDFESGLDVFDDQHRLLVDLINELSSNLDAEGTEAAEHFHTVVTRTFEFASNHFADEEKMMREIGVDSRHFGQHFTDHQRFIEQLNNIWDARHTITSPASVLLEFLVAWIRFHILDEDQSLVRQIKRIQAGESPSEAYEAVEASIDRTNSIRAAGRHLHQVMAEQIEYLVKSNQLLEARVMERTRELETCNQRLEMLSRMDGVLGISNRAYFDERIKTEWRLARRNKQPISLLMVDVDFLRQYNEAYGHLEGDNCLRSVARAMREGLFRPTDTVARFGGEELVALLPNTSLDGARLVAERIKTTVDSYAIPHAASSISTRVTVSIGLATMEPDKGGEGWSLLIQVEDALLQAKKRGRNQIQAYRDGSPLKLAKS